MRLSLVSFQAKLPLPVDRQSHYIGTCHLYPVLIAIFTSVVLIELPVHVDQASL